MAVIIGLGIIAIALQGYRTYQRQEYWLDRQIAKLIRYLRSLLR